MITCDMYGHPVKREENVCRMSHLAAVHMNRIDIERKRPRKFYFCLRCPVGIDLQKRHREKAEALNVETRTTPNERENVMEEKAILKETAVEEKSTLQCCDCGKPGMNLCHSCRGKRSGAAKRLKREQNEQRAFAPKWIYHAGTLKIPKFEECGPVPKVENVPPNPPPTLGMTTLVPLGEVEGLESFLKENAKENLRTVPMQILWILKGAMS